MNLRPLLISALLIWCGLAARQVRAEVQPVWGVNFGQPHKLSGSLGLLIGHSDRRTLLPLGTVRGLIVQAEPGLAGGKLAVGFTNTYLTHWQAQFAGFGARAVLLRTWGRPIRMEPRRTLAGIEIDGSLYAKVRLGALWPIDNAASSRRAYFSAALGFGF
ncbi:MAG: hypothetical protein MUF51_06085 [Vicinamibacteria bacterium]|jgi:hypothetical protein|nr:hypothetical protein [Vicinamibacteria bacterium]